jgi:hypothetical protein
MATTIAITRGWYTTSVLMATGHQRAGTRITEDLRNRVTQEILTKDLPKTSSEAKLRTEDASEADADTHQDPYTV